PMNVAYQIPRVCGDNGGSYGASGACHQRSFCLTVGCNTTAACAGIRHPASVTTVGVPWPPYSGSSLDQRICQVYPSGAATSGSANEGASRSGPKFTTSRRSSSAEGVVYRNTKSSGPST